MTLEERITRLEDIEAIRYLQAKYQRCLDSREFDNLASCFTEDAVSSYGNGKMSYDGRDAIIKYLCSVMTLDMPSSHLIHGGEIDWIDTEHAKGKWYLEDYLILKKYGLKLHGAAIYHVEYRKENDQWLICSIGYERTYEYMEGRHLMNRLTLKNMTLFDKVKNADPETLGTYDRYFHDEVLNKKNKKKEKKTK